MPILVFSLCFLLSIFSPTATFANASVLTDVQIDRFMTVVPAISETVIQAWHETVVDSRSDFDKLSVEYAKNDHLISALNDKLQPKAMAPDIFAVMLGIIVVSYQAQRDILEKEIGFPVSDQQIVLFLENMENLTPSDVQEIRRTLEFLNLAQKWLGQANVSLLNRRITELSSVIREFNFGGNFS